MSPIHKHGIFKMSVRHTYEVPSHLAKSALRNPVAQRYHVNQRNDETDYHATAYLVNSDEYAMRIDRGDEERDMAERQYEQGVEASRIGEIRIGEKPSRAAFIQQVSAEENARVNSGLTKEAYIAMPRPCQSIASVMRDQMLSAGASVGDIGVPLSSEEIIQQAFNPELMGGKPVLQNYNDDVPVWATRQNTYNADVGDLGIIQVPKVSLYQQGAQSGTIGTDNYNIGNPTGEKPRYKKQNIDSENFEDIAFPSNYLPVKKVRNIYNRVNMAETSWWHVDDIRIEQERVARKTTQIAKGEELTSHQQKKQEVALQDTLGQFTQYKMTQYSNVTPSRFYS
jgi:hypothetical protein